MYVILIIFNKNIHFMNCESYEGTDFNGFSEISLKFENKIGAQVIQFFFRTVSLSLFPIEARKVLN